MKICIVSMTNLFLCPYIKKYISILPPKMDLIYWNRHNIEEDVSDFNITNCFTLELNENSSKIKKLVYCIRFKMYCKKIIKKNNYDKIIFLHNYLPILMWRYLSKKYYGKYLIDIRDYSLEHNKLFYMMEKNAILNSGLAIISSEGFNEFLPKCEYVLCHNNPQVEENIIEKIRNRNLTDPIQLSFIGLVRFYEQNKKIIDLFGNNDKFVLAFYGQNSDILKEYAEKKNAENVVCIGHFEPSKTAELYLKTDVINNYYGSDSRSLIFALSNKLYYAATFHIPILVCKNTFMEQIANKYGFGIVLDEDKINCSDEFYEKIKTMDKKKMAHGCDEFLRKVAVDDEIFKRKMEDFLSK